MKKMENEKKVRIVYATVIMTTLLFLTTSSILLANAAIPKQRNSFSMEYDSTNQSMVPANVAAGPSETRNYNKMFLWAGNLFSDTFT